MRILVATLGSYGDVDLFDPRKGATVNFDRPAARDPRGAASC